MNSPDLKSIDCPICGITNPPESLKCDCGFEFTSLSSDQIVAMRNLNAKKYLRIAIVSFLIDLPLLIVHFMWKSHFYHDHGFTFLSRISFKVISAPLRVMEGVFLGVVGWALIRYLRMNRSQ